MQGGEGEGFEVGECRVSREEVPGGSRELGCRFRTLELEEEDNDIAVAVRLARIGNKSTLAEVEEILPILAGESKTCQLIQKRNVVRGLFEKFPEEGFGGRRVVRLEDGLDQLLPKARYFCIQGKGRLEVLAGGGIVLKVHAEITD